MINHPVKPASPVIEEVVVEEEELPPNPTPPPAESEPNIEVIVQEATDLGDEEIEKSETEPTKEVLFTPLPLCI